MGDAQGLPQRMAVDARADILGDLALEELRRANGELHHLHAALNLALRVGQHFAVLGRDHGGELVGPLLQDAQEGIQNAGPAQRRGPHPHGRRRHGCLDGRADVAARCERNAPGLRTRCRVEDRREAIARSRELGATDEMTDDLGHPDTSSLLSALVGAISGIDVSGAQIDC